MEAAGNQERYRQPDPSNLRLRYCPLVLVALALAGCVRETTEKPYGCATGPREAVYGLSGEWRWHDGMNARRLCLRQVSPVRLLGMTELRGHVEPVSGAVAPT